VTTVRNFAALAVGDLVHADAVQPVETVVVEMRGDESLGDRVDGVPGGAQQGGGGGLGHPFGQPAGQVFDVAGVSGAGAGERHPFGADLPAAGAVDPPDPGLDVDLAPAEVDVPPPAAGGVIRGPALPSARADQHSGAQPDLDQQGLVGERHRLHHGSGKAQQTVE
jgi:hypothetical protein